jgi:hypothetical protein
VAVGKKAALATSLSARASVMRRTAARRSRFEAVLRSIREDSVGSWNVVHQLTTATGSVLTALEAVDVGDHPAGTCGSGCLKLGPTEQLEAVAANAATRSQRKLDFLDEIIGASRDPVAKHP